LLTTPALKSYLLPSLVTNTVDSSVDKIYIDTRLSSEVTSCGVGIKYRIRPASCGLARLKEQPVIAQPIKSS
jgi:hypothetical protein